MSKTCFICQSCGAIHSKWQGRCQDCNEWNSIVEEVIEKNKTNKNIDNSLEFKKLDSPITDTMRFSTNINELDRVLGGGLVLGSAILIGGDPGIGKSTLLLQLVARLALLQLPCAYITGEESVQQVQLRATRLGLEKSPVKLLAATNIDDIISLLNKERDIALIVIDSVQTMFTNSLNSAPGTVSQVKAISHELISFAKAKNIIVIFVGHVTKDGQLAGPKVLEHVVDTVLYFEGDRGQQFRILRSVKNRFGGINEIGVFEMQELGLVEISNPSTLFLSPKEQNVSGSVVYAGTEGTRPILAEIQSLVAPSFIPTPRRSVVGWDLNRLSMLIAVLNSRYGMNLFNKEVYLNIVGGLKINEPAADLAALCSIISSVTNIALPPLTVIFGEIGLSGEVRKVTKAAARLKEAKKLGFKKALVPFGTDFTDNDMVVEEIGHITQLKDIFRKSQ
jgi:DNA repair protein RadA/Sms